MQVGSLCTRTIVTIDAQRLVHDVLARDPLEMDIHVADLATTELAMIAENAELDDAIATMHESGVRRLLVSDSEERLCGLFFDRRCDPGFGRADRRPGPGHPQRPGARAQCAPELARPLPPAQIPRFPAMGTAAQASR
jgi:CBS domain